MTDITDLKYKGMTGDINFDPSKGNFYGKLQDVSRGADYSGESVEELVENFREAVNEFRGKNN